VGSSHAEGSFSAMSMAGSPGYSYERSFHIVANGRAGVLWCRFREREAYSRIE